MSALTQRQNYFESLAATCDAIIEAGEDRGLLLDFGSDAACELWPQHVRNSVCDAGHLAYGDSRRHDYKIKAIKGKPTRKYFHVTIYRTTNGRYELNTYVL